MSDELSHLVEEWATGRMSRREFMGRASAMGVSAAVAGSFTASAAMAETPVKGGTLRAGVNGAESTNSLDPALSASNWTFVVNETWGEKLTEMNGDGTLNMRLAEEVSSTKDAVTWKFKIRKGVKFHNGKDVTADDVIATLKRHTDKKSKSGALGIVKGIADMKAEGDMVTLTLAGGNADLPYLMTDYHLVIQPGGGVDKPDAGIGAGPYKVKSFEPGVRATMEKFADYWDDSRGHADQVEVLGINDGTARTAALQSGQVDMINRVDPKIVGLLKRIPGVTIEATPGPGHYLFAMQCSTPPFDNNDLRMALKLAANREEILQKILGGFGTVGNDFPINSAYPLFDDSIPQRTFDPKKAAEYYKKSGHDGSPIVLEVAAAAFPGAIEAAQLYQQSCQAAGIPLQIKRDPDDGYWSNVWNKQPFCASYWVGRPVQDQMYSTAYQSTSNWNATRFNNKKFDDLLIAARAETDEAKRKKMYSEMAMILRDNGGAIILVFNNFIAATGPHVGGWTPNAHGGEMMSGKALSECWRKA